MEDTEQKPLIVVFYNQRPEGFWAYSREAVCDGTNVVDAHAHYRAFELFHQKFYPTDTEQQFLDRVSVGGSLHNVLMHGWYNRHLHTFMWDYKY